MNWLLPEHISDALPLEAAQIERLRRQILDVCHVRGYELVIPPLLEHIESLLTGTAQDLSLRTFKLVDQISGKTLGIRADITPQVARIDAHLLNRTGVTRLCYCDSVLHTLPATVTASRHPIQMGAEIYGYAGWAADLEVMRLVIAILQGVGLTTNRIDLGHVGIFRALVVGAGLSASAESEILALLYNKDVPGLAQAVAELPAIYADALLALPELYGGTEVLAQAKELLPALPGITEALTTLETLSAAAPELNFSFDLADLRGYNYHNGVVFSVYTQGYPTALAAGGRYDGAGATFGRARPATGFSLDLRELARLAPVRPQAGAILAPAISDPVLEKHIAALRKQGEVVLQLLPGEEADTDGLACDRCLVAVDGQWVIESN